MTRAEIAARAAIAAAGMTVFVMLGVFTTSVNLIWVIAMAVVMPSVMTAQRAVSRFFRRKSAVVDSP